MEKGIRTLLLLCAFQLISRAKTNFAAHQRGGHPRERFVRIFLEALCFDREIISRIVCDYQSNDLFDMQESLDITYFIINKRYSDKVHCLI